MQIKDLQPRQGKVELIATVVEIGEVREFEKFGNKGRVCTAKIRDDSGDIGFTLWNDQIDTVGVGDKVQVKNGYVNEYRGDISLTSGKFGSFEVIEKGAGAPPAESAPAEQPGPEPKKDEFDDINVEEEML